MQSQAIYVSSHKLPVRDDGTSPAFDEIGRQALDRNASLGLSFFLVCTHHWFCQVLEGPAPELRRTLARIVADPRHYDCRIVESAGLAHIGKLDGYATVHKSIANRLIFLERGFSRSIVPYDRSAADLLDLCNALQRFGIGDDRRGADAAPSYIAQTAHAGSVAWRRDPQDA